MRYITTITKISRDILIGAMLGIAAIIAIVIAGIAVLLASVVTAAICGIMFLIGYPIASFKTARRALWKI